MTTDTILDTIGAIYDAALDAGAWPAALERFGDLIGGVPAIAVFQDGTGAIPMSSSVRRSEESQIEYVQHYSEHDPIRSFVQRAPAQVYTDRMIMPKSELTRTEFFNDYARRWDMHGVIQGFAFRDSDSAGVIAATCPRGADFEDKDVRLLTVLLPHFGRAMRLQLRLRAAQVQVDSTAAALDRMAQAVFFVEVGGHVAYANRAAEAMLARADGISADATGLRASRSAQTTTLRRVIACAAAGNAPSGGSLLLDRPSGARPLSVTVTPLRPGAPPEWSPASRPAALVLVHDPARPGTACTAAQLRGLFGLTSAEAAVALLIGKGTGLKPAAAALGIAPSTARTHLSRIFAKTETGRQSELAALLGSLPTSSAD